jgi:hypothetical protein
VGRVVKKGKGSQPQDSFSTARRLEGDHLLIQADKIMRAIENRHDAEELRAMNGPKCATRQIQQMRGASQWR